MVRIATFSMIVGMSGRIFRFADLVGDEADLPCPWCRAATGEDDDTCPGCGQIFG